MFVGCWDEKRNSMKLKIKENTELIQKSWLKDPVLELSFFFYMVSNILGTNFINNKNHEQKINK